MGSDKNESANLDALLYNIKKKKKKDATAARWNFLNIQMNTKAKKKYINLTE